MKSEDLFKFVDRDQATSFQKKMASIVIHADDPDFRPQVVCGMDVAYDNDKAYAAASVWDSKDHVFLESINRIDEAPIAYMPGLLGFREGPIIFRTARLLRSKPDVFLVDGQGVAHPRRFGLASQFGLAVETPTVGVAKSRLYGRVSGETIIDPSGETIGTIVSSTNGKKFYVSVGHRISLETASRLVAHCMIGGHPAPLRQAHIKAEALRKMHL